MTSASADAQAPVIAVELFAATHIGRVRRNNEDNFLVADLSQGVCGLHSAVKKHSVGARGTLLLVSDGMGGALAGEVASRMAVELIEQELVTKKLAGSAEARLNAVIEKANLAIWHAGQSSSRQVGMGATLTAAIIESNTVYIGEIGDSRAYVIRYGAIIQLTKDQSMVQRLIDEGTITSKQAARHPHRNIILQSLGSQRKINVVISKLELCRNDILLICTDGLTNKVPDEEIKDIILGSVSIESACRNLVEAANRHGGEDNITVVLAKVSGESLPIPEEELDTTDSSSVGKELEERIRRKIADQYRLSNSSAPERLTDRDANNSYLANFADNNSDTGRVWKFALIAALALIILLLLLKLK
jgi:protein phosphatase